MLVGFGMLFCAFTESDSKTVFQQIGSRMLLVGGFVICGIAALIQAVSPVARQIGEIAVRLESIEERLVKTRK